MNGRITTTSETETKIIELQKVLKFSTKASVIRISIGLSLKNNSDPRNEFKKHSNHTGATYQIATITGNHDELYRALLIEHISDYNLDEKNLLELFSAHIVRGVNILYSEYQLRGNYDKIVDFIFSLM